ncbi:MAG: HAMP domain-containing histidine kinase [Streptosporangiaceae bacterium]|nr:HAMP domain-containing histidine kinase [Streptosporangiaceae bacterium]
MTRRIVLALVAFTAAVIAGAVVPLALNAVGHDRSSFIAETAGIVQTYAAVAQARLEGGRDPALIPVVSEVEQSGDGLLIVTSGMRTIVDVNMPAGNWTRLALQADQQARYVAHQTIQPLTTTTASTVVAAMPVRQYAFGPVVGTVILARSTAPLNQSITALWVTLAAIGAAALAGAALLAFVLARWVRRPLAGLDGAARRLADGDLAVRAAVGSGPRELRRLGTTFNTMAGRLEALVHGNRAVIADVSHQLRTPLAALRLRLDLLAADTAESDPDTARELAGALDELARLSRLVDGLLAVARAENVVPVPVAVDVAAVAAERVAAWHPVADDRGITLAASEAARGAGPVLALLGEGHLEQILDNLIANALDALDGRAAACPTHASQTTPDGRAAACPTRAPQPAPSAGGRVVVATAATPAGARVTVADNGPGMSAEDRQRAFLPFATSSPTGTGLGLAIVHRLSTSNGGTADLAETPGGGLTVTIDLPGVPAPDGAAAGAGLPMGL